MLGIQDDPRNRVTNILCRCRKGDIGDKPIVRNHHNKPAAGIESGYASINQAKGLGRETAISSVKTSAVDKEEDRSICSLGGNGIINVKLLFMLELVGNKRMVETGYLMPIGRTVLESLLWNLADERSFGFQQWSKTGDGYWMVVVKMSRLCTQNGCYTLGLVTLSISLSFI